VELGSAVPLRLLLPSSPRVGGQSRNSRLGWPSMITQATSHVGVEAGVEGKERGIKGQGDICVCGCVGADGA